MRPSPCVGINLLSPAGRSTFSHDGGPQPASPRLVQSKCEHHWLMREVPPTGRFLGLRHTACPETRQWLYRERSPRVFGDYGDRALQAVSAVSRLIARSSRSGVRSTQAGDLVLSWFSTALPALPTLPELGHFLGAKIRGLQLGVSTGQLHIPLVSSPPKIRIMIPTRLLG